jgi:hypothetical protein
MVNSGTVSDEWRSDDFQKLLPTRVDRRQGAEIVTRHCFPVSARTLEVWPLTWRRINGRALVETKELLEYARTKVDAATPIRGGRRGADQKYVTASSN